LCPNSILARTALAANRETHKDSAGADLCKRNHFYKTKRSSLFSLPRLERQRFERRAELA
jgi:hypothetical protein